MNYLAILEKTTLVSRKPSLKVTKNDLFSYFYHLNPIFEQGPSQELAANTNSLLEREWQTFKSLMLKERDEVKTTSSPATEGNHVAEIWNMDLCSCLLFEQGKGSILS
jgi:hypothetical protein